VKRRDDAMTKESEVDMNEAMQLTKHIHDIQAPKFDSSAILNATSGNAEVGSAGHIAPAVAPIRITGMKKVIGNA
jgi:hypothetical protein